MLDRERKNEIRRETGGTRSYEIRLIECIFNTSKVFFVSFGSPYIFLYCLFLFPFFNFSLILLSFNHLSLPLTPRLSYLSLPPPLFLIHFSRRLQCLSVSISLIPHQHSFLNHVTYFLPAPSSSSSVCLSLFVN